MVGTGTNIKSVAYVGNLAAFLRHSMSFGPGEHLYNYIDKPDMDVNALVARVDRALGRSGGRIRVPYSLAYLGGWCFDVLSRLTGRSFVFSRVRVEKFCSQTLFSANRVRETGFDAPYAIDEALDRSLAWVSGRPVDVKPEMDLADEDLPVVSVVVPMRNEVKDIGECLDTLLAQEYPQDRLEILVVDGQSSDGSRELVERYAASNPSIRGADQRAPRDAGRLQHRGPGRDRSGGGPRQRAQLPGVRGYVRGVRVRPRAAAGADGVGGVMRPQGRNYLGKAIGMALGSRFGAGGFEVPLRDRGVVRRYRSAGNVPAGGLRARGSVRRGPGPQPGLRAQLPHPAVGRDALPHPAHRLRVPPARVAGRPVEPVLLSTDAGRYGR